MPKVPSLKRNLSQRPFPPKREGPVWKGPEVDGITYSLLSRFLCCRERFRLHAIEGLRPSPTFNHRTEYGQMWHICEELLAGKDSWDFALREYCKGLCKKYPTQQEQIQHWFEVCRVQFPLYVRYWSKHSDVRDRRPLLQEQVFDVPYSLPSGRMVRLRGKWDSVDLIGKEKNAGIYLQENKTKGDIDEIQMKRQLSSGFDLQTMLYLVALILRQDTTDDLPRSKLRDVRGVRYNVVRRPLSGGKGSIVRHKPSKSNPDGESTEEFYARLGEIIKEDPGSFFIRWKVEVLPSDVKRFRLECLDPILEQLCDWWMWVSGVTTLKSAVHYRFPYGVWNPLIEGGNTDLDEYLNTGSEVGLERRTELFGEL